MSNNTCHCDCSMDPNLSWVGAIAFAVLVSIALVWYYSTRRRNYVHVPPEDLHAQIPPDAAQNSPAEAQNPPDAA